MFSISLLSNIILTAIFSGMSYYLTTYLITHDEVSHYSKSQVKYLGLVALSVVIIAIGIPYFVTVSASVVSNGAVRYGSWQSVALLCSISTMLAVTGVVDAATKYVYDLILLAFTVLNLVLLLMIQGPIMGHLEAGKNMAYGAVVGGGTYLAIRLIAGWLFKKEAFGMGDVILMTAIGVVLGPRDTLLVAIGSFYVGLILIALIWLFKRDIIKGYIPFGPFMCLTAWLVLHWGEQFIGVYMRIFLGY